MMLVCVRVDVVVVYIGSDVGVVTGYDVYAGVVCICVVGAYACVELGAYDDVSGHDTVMVVLM